MCVYVCVGGRGVRERAYLCVREVGGGGGGGEVCARAHVRKS